MNGDGTNGKANERLGLVPRLPISQASPLGQREGSPLLTACFLAGVSVGAKDPSQQQSPY